MFRSIFSKRKMLTILTVLFVVFVAFSVQTKLVVAQEHTELIFEDDFEDMDISDWQFSTRADGVFDLNQDGGNTVLSMTDDLSAHSLYGDRSLSDYTFESKIKALKITPSIAQIEYRLNDNGYYFAQIATNRIALFKNSFTGAPVELTKTDSIFYTEKWYTIRIVGHGNNIKVFVDDELQIDYTDNDSPFLKGEFGFQSLEESHIYIDDVKVYTSSTSTLPTTTHASEPKDLLIDGMEDVSRWKLGIGRETQLLVSEDSSYVKEGSKSLKLEYSGRTKGCDECRGHIVFYRGEFSEWKKYEGITFWVYNPKDNIEIEVRAHFHEKTPSGRSVYRNARSLRTKGWHNIEFSFVDFYWHTKSDFRLPFDLENFNHFDIQFRSEASSFTVYIDDLKLYGLLPPTTTPTPKTTAPPTTTPAPTTQPPTTTPAPTTVAPIVVSRSEVVDSDGDGWSDELEKRIGSNPFQQDSDGDGIIDSKDPNPLKYGAEMGTDSDGDGWSDELEKKAGTDPFDKDTDGDGMWDSKDPNPLVPLGEENGINWEAVGVGLAVLAASGGWIVTNRKKSRMKRLLDDIDKTYESFKMNSRRCEAELYRHRSVVSEQLKNGKIDEESYSILDKRLDDYLKEIKQRIMEERLPPKCPSCGSPFQGKDGDKCEYCGSVVRREEKIDNRG